MQSKFKQLVGSYVSGFGFPLFVVAVSLESERVVYMEHAVFLPEQPKAYHFVYRLEPSDEVPLHLDAVLLRQLEGARTFLEHLVLQAGKELHEATFMGTQPFLIKECKEDIFRNYRMEGIFGEELVSVAQKTRCPALKREIERVLSLPAGSKNGQGQGQR